MVFLSEFNLSGKGDEYYYFTYERVGARSIPSYYNSYYPFRFLDDKGLESIEFSDVTISFFSIRMNFNLNCHDANT